MVIPCDTKIHVNCNTYTREKCLQIITSIYKKQLFKTVFKKEINLNNYKLYTVKFKYRLNPKNYHLNLIIESRLPLRVTTIIKLFIHSINIFNSTLENSVSRNYQNEPQKKKMCFVILSLSRAPRTIPLFVNKKNCLYNFFFHPVPSISFSI